MNPFVAFSIFLLVSFLCIDFSVQYPSQPRCYSQICPSGTTNCKKNIRSSYDRTKLEIRISCLDDYDGSLKEYYFEEPSSVNPHTHYESSSYSAAEGVDNTYSSRNNNGLEDFY